MADDNVECSQWRESEVSELINIWGDSSVQAKLEGSYRNRAVFENISKEMAERGYKRSWLQCQRKIKSLRAKYKEAKDSNKRSGRGRVTCPFYEELDRILGDKPSVQPIQLLDSSFAEEEPEETSPGPAASVASPASSSSGETGDGTLVSLSTSSSTSEESSTPSEDTSLNSSAAFTSSGSTFAKNRKRKSKMEATLEVFANKISSAFKNEDADLLLKMQAAQHEHDLKMFTMLSQFMERSNHPPPPPFYQAPMQPSQLYNPRQPPTHHSSLFPVASAPSPTQPMSFLQDLNQPPPFNNAHPHPRSLTQPFFQAPVNTQGQHAFISQDHPPPFQPQDEDEI